MSALEIRNKKQRRQMIFAFLFLASMLVIFCNSQQTATVSSSVSTGITEKVVPIVIPKYQVMSEPQKNNTILTFNRIFRECAHAIEFFPLGLFGAFWADSLLRGKRRLLTTAASVLFCFIFALSDEFHQMFVSGRGSEWLDVGMDTLGGFSGAVFAAAILFIFRKLHQKRMNHQKASRS